MIGIQVELDKMRTLRLTINSVSLFDEMSNTSFLELTDQLEKGKLTISQVRMLIWAMLLHEDESLTVKDAGEIMQAGIEEERTDLAEIMEKMTLAVINFLIPRKERGKMMSQFQEEKKSSTTDLPKKNLKKKSTEE